MKLKYPFYQNDDGAGSGAPPAGDPPAAPAVPPASTPPPAGDPPGTPLAKVAPKWLSQCSKERQAAIPESLYEHDTVDKLTVHAETLEKKLANAIVMPGPDATPEEIKATLAKLGIPENKDGYELDAKLLKAKDAETITAGIKDLALKHGFNRTQAKAVFDYMAKLGEAGEAEKVQAAATQEEAFKTGMLSRYAGDEAKAQVGIRMGESFLARRVKDPEAIKALFASGLTKNHAVVSAFAKIEEAFTDPKFIEGHGGKNTPGGNGTFKGEYSPEFENTIKGA